MARLKNNKSVGVKELKDQASAIIEEVLQDRHTFTVTRNNRDVARIVPIEAEQDNPYQALEDLGLIAAEPKEPWSTLKLRSLGVDPTPAIIAIRADRDDD